MKDYLNEINELFPVRRKDSEKADFYNYVRTELGSERCVKEILEKKHHNIVIGDIEKAKVIFTAHYDTPSQSLVPNLMFPTGKLIGTLYHLIFPITMALFSLFAAVFITVLAGIDEIYAPIFYLFIYFGLFYATTRMLPNKHNKNDNTSGVATIMSLATEYNESDVAFVLFDNEEKGILGSKAFSKNHKDVIDSKLIINFDCVGNGNQMIFVAKELAEKLPEYEILKATVTDDDGFEVHYVPVKKALSNSDYKSFNCGIGVLASHKVPIFKLCTGRIHTARDTVADSKNVYFLTNKMLGFVKKI